MILSEDEKQRWKKHTGEYFEKSQRRRGDGYGLSCVSRDAEDVRVVAEAVCCVKPQFMYKNIRKMFSLSRHDGVCALNALISDGFVCVLSKKRGNSRVYRRLFGKDDVDRVVRSVVR